MVPINGSIGALWTRPPMYELSLAPKRTSLTPRHVKDLGRRVCGFTPHVFWA